MELPGVYQQVRLACPEFDVVGFAFPGVPGLPHFAHTGHTAWAVTNAMADYQDLYVEELRRITDSNGERIEAHGAEGWEPAVVSTETISVRGGDAVTVEVIETARGPVISEMPDDGALSLRFPARVEGRLGFEALLPLLRSRSVADVEAAFDAWVEPVNSVVAADSSGAVRHFVAGLVPQRNPANRRLPTPALSPRHAWEGPYVALPRTEVRQFAVSANDRAAGGGDAVAMEFAPSYRALRIQQLLESAPAGTLSGDTMQGIHTDTLLGPWPFFRKILAALETTGLSDEARKLRSQLLAWDGRMDAGSHPAAVFAAWRGALVQRLGRHAALAPLNTPSGYSPLFGPWLSVASRIGFALETLLARGSELGIAVSVEAAAALEATALEEALLDGGSWGDRHTLLAIHVLPETLAAAAPTAALSGDTGCVLSTESLPGVDDRSFRGPVARYVWDLDCRENSRWIVPFGAAGSPGHSHFADQLPLWSEGRMVPVTTDWSALAKDPN
jgi:penicillin amidase